MSYRLRNILFLIFAFVFVILTTFFSLYASGYKISLIDIINGKGLIQKTGILAVDSVPRGARVYLTRQIRGILFDNEVVKNKNIRTPYKIKNLLPGEYILQFDLEGYWPWQQKVNVFPGQSTYFEDVVLFKRNLPTIFFSSNLQKISLDSSEQKIILEKDNKLIDLKSATNIDLGENIESIEVLNGPNILLNNSLIFDYAKNKYFDFTSDKYKGTGNLKIKNGQLFYLQDGLNSYNFSSDKVSQIFSDPNILDYDFYNGFYFLIIKENNLITLKIYSYRNKELIRDIVLPGSDNLEIIDIKNNSSFVYVYDRDFSNIYVINTTSRFNSLWSTINEVKGWSFIDSNNFVYFSDFEIYIFNSFLAEKFLVGRFDSQIKSLVWHPKNYIIYSTLKDIIILDMKYDKYSIKLVSLEEVSNLVLDKMGSVLYFSGKIGNQTGLYKLFIQ